MIGGESDKMRDFLIANAVPVIAGIAVLELILTVLLAVCFGKKKSVTVLLMALIALGLTFDAAVMALGSVMPEGLLSVLSRVRFIGHGILIPLNIALCGCVLDWQGTKKQTVLWIITAVVCVLGAASGIARQTELRELGGIVRYASAGAPLWAEKINRVLSFGTVLPLLAAGIGVIIKKKNPCIFLAAFLMFVFSALGPATGNADLIFLISMFGELLMVLFFLLHAKTAVRDGDA